MKHLIKHFTVGAVLGLAVMFSGIGEANATLLDGKVVGVDFIFPTLATPAAFTENQLVGGGIEYGLIY